MVLGRATQKTKQPHRGPEKTPHSLIKMPEARGPAPVKAAAYPASSAGRIKITSSTKTETRESEKRKVRGGGVEEEEENNEMEYRQLIILEGRRANYEIRICDLFGKPTRKERNGANSEMKFVNNTPTHC